MYGSDKELCIYQGTYSACYFIGAMLVSLKLSKNVDVIKYLFPIAGFLVFGLGLYDSYASEKNEDHSNSILFVLDFINILLGLIDGIIEPTVLQKIVTNTNRPEFFTGLFYFLSSVSAMLVIAIPSYIIFREGNYLVFTSSIIFLCFSYKIIISKYIFVEFIYKKIDD